MEKDYNKIIYFTLFSVSFSLVLWVLGYFYLRKIGRKTEEYSDWLWPIHWAKFAQTPMIFLVSIIWANVSVSVLICSTSVFVTEPAQLLVSPGILFAILAVVFTLATLVNTFILKQREELKEYDEFGKFLEELIKCFPRYANKSGSYIYIADFTPCIGSITLGLSNATYQKYRDTLIGVTEGVCKVKIISYDDSNIQDFHIKMQVENANDYFEHVKKTLDLIDSPTYIKTGRTRSKVTIDEAWRGKEIGSWHLIVTPNETYQYVVLPEPNGKKHMIAVIKRKEAFYINILKRAFEDMLADSITPRPKPSQGALKLYFTPQDNIQSIKCFLSNNPSFDIIDHDVKILYTKENEITISQNDKSGLCVDICSDCLNCRDYLRVVLKKTTGIESCPSKVVKIQNFKK